ncbi:tyrosyl-tRNA synthetase [Mycoplasmopsis mustelae]|uniref:Tyrosine--tRNA ligase n=1 Tax=Mycoplasmopsis mustelae TaxID=171289 RepID=A0A4R7UCY4_9BACT|nr:tyrosine--tRNA ligase [Mycoplasmopsis mustelae]TDV24269.1 tyrosyl-tRNA synthetase [Mycoplasmopsis mustelae]
MKNILKEFELRGILKQHSNINKFYNLTNEDGVYAGFDPTAISLHLGNYLQILTLLRMQKAGWKTIAILGGATGMIGDPSFKNAERKLLDNDVLLTNKTKIKKQLESFGLKVIDNYDFYKNMNFLTFLREAGKLINVAYMLSKDSVATRIENGLSFTEFSYQLIQGWDFISLYQDYNVKIQVGGSDQWGNISTGLEMISKKFGDNHKAFIFTTNLLTDENDNKFGKSTGGGNLWLDKEMTKPFDMYQFLFKQPDSQIEKLLKWLTFLSLDQIAEIMKEHNLNPTLQFAQRTLAFEVIKDLHGESEAKKVQQISEILFNKNLDLNQISIDTIISINDEIINFTVKKGQNIVDELIKQKLLQSKREAKEFIEKGAIKINLETINLNNFFESKFFSGKFAILHIGKKKVVLVRII